MEHLVVLGTYSSRIDAEMFCEHLKSHGINTLLKSDDCGGMYPQFTTMFRVKVYVDQDDVDVAMDILNPDEEELG